MVCHECAVSVSFPVTVVKFPDKHNSWERGLVLGDSPLSGGAEAVGHAITIVENLRATLPSNLCPVCILCYSSTD